MPSEVAIRRNATSPPNAPISREAPRWKRYITALLAEELSSLTHYSDCLIEWLPRDEDGGLLLSQINATVKRTVGREEDFPDLRSEMDQGTTILINGALNHHNDIQGLLEGLKSRLSRTSRVLLVLYNPYLRWLYALANRLGIRRGEMPTTFVTRVDIDTLARLSGFAVVRQRLCGYFPWRLWGFGNLINRVLPLVPVLRWYALTYIVVLRPLITQLPEGVSCVIPARNERGNIEDALRRFPDLGCPTEIIFVEGGSSDGTWDEIRRVAEVYGSKFRIKVVKQTGRGKANAVRLGFSHATHPLLTILDADLTMPPELLSRYCQAYWDGLGDFINGSRLVYPMEGEAMRFLNRIGNVFFAKALSWVLDVPLGDSLCGTKLMTRRDYARMTTWRNEFGDFDPFGDFELLFPAAVLGLGIIDIPVRYRARTYGSTNIHRFSHGFELLKMVVIGFIRIKLGFGRRVVRAPAATVAPR